MRHATAVVLLFLTLVTDTQGAAVAGVTGGVGAGAGGATLSRK